MSLIEVKGLKKSFGSLEVLKGVDVNVEQGERIAIIGGSGCGKSVFLRSLCLLEKPDAGQIFIDGKEITAAGAKVDEIRRSMGMVFQKFHLFSEMDVMDNLCLAPVRLKGMFASCPEIAWRAGRPCFTCACLANGALRRAAAAYRHLPLSDDGAEGSAV